MMACPKSRGHVTSFSKKLLMSRIHVNIASNGWRKIQITEQAPAKGHAIKIRIASQSIPNIGFDAMVQKYFGNTTSSIDSEHLEFFF
mmetsp:Transcript_36606/g.40897  ORF Transcript_36606/g.40897 Transcript_36606/m.40897 type:complete len:87 (+) Transcript_36606:475-735(+)